MKAAKIILALAGAFCLMQTALAAAPTPDAWFLKSADGRQWCAFTDLALARQAGSSDRFDGSETAWITIGANGIRSLVHATASQDSYVEDSYSFDGSLRVTRMIRHGHHVDDPFLDASYAPGKDGHLALTPASAVVRKRQDRAKRETDFLDWPTFARFADMPYHDLVATGAKVPVTQRCIRIG